MELYNLGNDIVAFTTDRTQGRDMNKIRETIIKHFPTLQGKIDRGLYPHQTHTDNVFHITKEFLELPEESMILSTMQQQLFTLAGKVRSRGL